MDIVTRVRAGGTRDRALSGTVRCLLLQVRCLSRALTGLSWTVAAWITTRPSTGLDGFKEVWI